MIIISMALLSKSVPSEESQVDHKQSVKISFSMCHLLTLHHESCNNASLHKVLLWLDSIRTLTDGFLPNGRRRGRLQPAAMGTDEDR
jgi:hypothetical protein